MRRLLLSLVLLAFSQLSFAAEDVQYLVFVGEPISITEVPPKKDELRFDAEFRARYRVLETYRGDYEGDEIEFTVFDHYGFPPFANYKHVLLYVEHYEGEYYHSKNQFSPLYMTKSGRWAAPYATSDYNHSYNADTAIRPERIDFVEPVEIDLSGYSRKERKKWFPEPYYRIKGGKATAVFGNYVPELFLLKQGGVLKARGDFQ